MIRVSEVDYHISLFPEDTICEGVTRKYIEFNKTRLYLHPGDPRFGASLDGILYSFRRIVNLLLAFMNSILAIYNFQSL